MENTAYLLGAFIVVWAVLFGYVIFLVRRQTKLLRDAADLKKRPD